MSVPGIAGERFFTGYFFLALPAIALRLEWPRAIGLNLGRTADIKVRKVATGVCDIVKA